MEIHDRVGHGSQEDAAMNATSMDHVDSTGPTCPSCDGRGVIEIEIGGGIAQQTCDDCEAGRNLAIAWEDAMFRGQEGRIEREAGGYQDLGSGR